MRCVTIVFAAVLAVLAGCQPGAVSQEPDDINDTINQAVVMGADIPPDKRPMVMRILQLSEKDLILGLRAYADLSGGRYPASLDTKKTLKQVETDRLGESRPDLSENRREQMLQDIFFATAFYDKLAREGRNAQYHGDTIGRQDAGKVLVAWNESKQQCRVIFGDLSVKTLSAEQFTQLPQSP